MPVIATNTAANSAVRYLNYNNMQTQSSVSKLASGSRITKASDDAAGLAIGYRLQTDVGVMQQASTNASQAVSVLQVADGGLARIGDVLDRMKTLAAASLSGVPTDAERVFIDAEYQALESEIDGIAQTTRFNGESLLDGTSAQWNASVDFFVGTRAADVINIDILGSAPVANFLNAGLNAGGGFGNVANAANAATELAAVEVAIGEIADSRADVGALISRFEVRGQQIATSIENTEAAVSAIMDVDIAAEQSKMVANQVLVQSAVSALSQANQLPQSLLRVLQ